MRTGVSVLRLPLCVTVPRRFNPTRKRHDSFSVWQHTSSYLPARLEPRRSTLRRSGTRDSQPVEPYLAHRLARCRLNDRTVELRVEPPLQSFKGVPRFLFLCHVRFLLFLTWKMFRRHAQVSVNKKRCWRFMFTVHSDLILLRRYGEEFRDGTQVWFDRSTNCENVIL